MAIALKVIAVLFLSISCSKDKRVLGEAVTNRDSTSVMTTRGITSLISENGIIKYRITTEEWQWFDKAKPSYQAFEKGAFLEVFDSTLTVSSFVKADTAYYFEDKKLWELRGNVHAENDSGEIFDTQLLFWSQQFERVYSDADIRIEKKDQILIGKGFESNQDFSNYSIRKTEGIFPIEDKEQ